MIDYCTQITGKLKSDARNNFVHLAITRRTGDYIDVDKIISCFSFSVLCIPFTSNETFRFNERERWQLTLNALQVFKLLRTRFS